MNMHRNEKAFQQSKPVSKVEKSPKPSRMERRADTYLSVGNEIIATLDQFINIKEVGPLKFPVVSKEMVKKLAQLEWKIPVGSTPIQSGVLTVAKDQFARADVHLRPGFLAHSPINMVTGPAKARTEVGTDLRHLRATHEEHRLRIEKGLDALQQLKTGELSFENRARRRWEAALPLDTVVIPRSHFTPADAKALGFEAKAKRMIITADTVAALGAQVDQMVQRLVGASQNLSADELQRNPEKWKNLLTQTQEIGKAVHRLGFVLQEAVKQGRAREKKVVDNMQLRARVSVAKRGADTLVSYDNPALSQLDQLGAEIEELGRTAGVVKISLKQIKKIGEVLAPVEHHYGKGARLLSLDEPILARIDKALTIVDMQLRRFEKGDQRRILSNDPAVASAVGDVSAYLERLRSAKRVLLATKAQWSDKQFAKGRDMVPPPAAR